MGVFETVVVAFWTMLPAYVPNNVAVLVGGGPAIDGGRTWRGARLLGDGKTWRGTIGGATGGFLLAQALNQVRPQVAEATGVHLVSFPLAAALALPVGAMAGDVLGSFLKRRTGRERGAPFPGIDQLDFVAVSLPLSALVAPDWFVDVFTTPVLAVVVVVTPILHVLTNAIAYVLGLKDEPY